MPGVWLIWVDAPEIASMSMPGQFLMVRCGGGLEMPLRRPLSIHKTADVGRGAVALLFNVVGHGTRWLSSLREGDRIDILGPLGRGFSLNAAAKNLLLVAGGMGIAPLAFLAQEALSQGHSITLLLGASSAPLLYPQSFLHSGVHLEVATEDGTSGSKGLVTDILPAFIDWADQIFACGPHGMYRTMAAQGYEALKGKSVQLSLEMRMGCGLGACYGCTVKTRQGPKQACREGPVFELDDIIWNELEVI